MGRRRLDGKWTTRHHRWDGGGRWVGVDGRGKLELPLTWGREEGGGRVLYIDPFQPVDDAR